MLGSGHFFRRDKKSFGGFTLLEILVALGIVSALSAAIYSSTAGAIYAAPGANSTIYKLLIVGQ